MLGVLRHSVSNCIFHGNDGERSSCESHSNDFSVGYVSVEQSPAYDLDTDFELSMLQPAKKDAYTARPSKSLLNEKLFKNLLILRHKIKVARHDF